MFSFSWDGARNGNETKFSQTNVYEKLRLVINLECGIPMH